MRIRILSLIFTCFIFISLTSSFIFAQVLEKGNDVYAGIFDNSFAILDGTLWAWGDNEFGQLGNGTMSSSYTPSQIGTSSDWASVASGKTHTLGLKTDGTLWRWGYVASFNIAKDYILSIQKTPIQLGTSNEWRKISSYREFEYGIKADGTLWSLRGAKLGNGATGARLTPTQMGTDHDWVDITSGLDHMLILKSDGSLWGLGDDHKNQIGTSPAEEIIIREHMNDALPTFNEQVLSIINESLNVPSLPNSPQTKYYPKMVKTVYHTFNYGIYDSIEAYITPKLITDSKKWISIDAGGNSNLGVTEDGKLWAWGNAGLGPFGNGYRVDDPNNILPIQIGTKTDWKSVSIGSGQVMASKTDGSIWRWGNGFRILSEEDLYPVEVKLDPPFVKFSAGSNYTLGLKADGTVWVAGWTSKALGLGGVEEKGKFTQIKGFVSSKSASTFSIHNDTLLIVKHCEDSNASLYVSAGFGMNFCANAHYKVQEIGIASFANYRIKIGNNSIYAITNYPEADATSKKQTTFEKEYLDLLNKNINLKKYKQQTTFKKSFKRPSGSTSNQYTVIDLDNAEWELTFHYIDIKKSDYSSFCFISVAKVGSDDVQETEKILNSINFFDNTYRYEGLLEVN